VGEQRRRHREQVGGVYDEARISGTGDLQHASRLRLKRITEVDAQGEARPAVETGGRFSQPGP